MKLLFVAFFMLSSFAASAACDREAQFIGTVKNLQVKATSFTFQVKAGRWFIPSMVCPMFEDELESAVIKIEGRPSISNGDEISGVMVFDHKTKTYKID